MLCESDAERYVPTLIEILNSKKLLFQNEGAMVVDVSEQTDTYSIPPVIIKKADDSNIYATTDLATIIQRVTDFHPQQYIERELLLNIAMSNEAFSSAFSEKAPNYICENTYQLASLFSKFYHNNHILNEPDKEKQAFWIFLCMATKRLLLKHLDMLEIEAVEFM